MNNNFLGWDSCRQSFKSLGSGIHYVAYQLGNSRAYRDKDVNGILRTHPRLEYSRLVKSVMDALGPLAFRAGPAYR